MVVQKPINSSSKKVRKCQRWNVWIFLFLFVLFSLHEYHNPLFTMSRSTITTKYNTNSNNNNNNINQQSSSNSNSRTTIEDDSNDDNNNNISLQQRQKELQQKEEQQQTQQEEHYKQQRQQRQRRMIYIDLGANCGNSYYSMKQGSNSGSSTTLKTNDTWEVYLFECNPQMIEWYLNDLVEKENKEPGSNIHVQLIPKAASTENGYATFYLTAGQENGIAKKEDMPNSQCDPNSAYNPSGASTFYKTAHRASQDNAYGNVQVETINFLQWHKDLQLQPGDSVHMKIDIEGAEVAILEQMLHDDDTNQICYWDVFWMEYHKDIFGINTTDYRIHEQFEIDFPKRFEEKCHRPLTSNPWS